MYGFPLTLDDCYDDDYELRLILALKQQVNETMNYHELKRAIDNDDGNDEQKRPMGQCAQTVVAVRSARFTARYTRPPCDHVGLWGSGGLGMTA